MAGKCPRIEKRIRAGCSALEPEGNRRAGYWFYEIILTAYALSTGIKDPSSSWRTPVAFATTRILAFCGISAGFGVLDRLAGTAFENSGPIS